PLPEPLLQKYNFMSRSQALINLHWPENFAQLQQAQRRFAFEELFLLNLNIVGKRQKLQNLKRNVIYKDLKKWQNEFLQLIPFTLTKAQVKVCQQIVANLQAPYPMNRMLQGDVGSGKTIVAAFAAFLAIKNGYQAAIMAPTEILAQQHWQKLQTILEPAGIRLGLLQGSMRAKEKRKIKDLLMLGLIDLVIGTHALIQEDVQFSKLGLVVVDEQHKFGVLQREAIKHKSLEDLNCDMLLMTATPIPRTMALTIYGDLYLSRLDELPPGRQPISSSCIPYEQAPIVYQFILKEISKGLQSYIICPLISESDRLEASAAIQEAERLKNSVFRDVRVGLLHGRMKASEKDQIMESFRRHEIDVLISTTVIEVGVDVPNASVMLIQDANRFGLAQLHQLRGRIGRGSQKSYCFFLASKDRESVRKLEAIARLSDGLDVAEEDLNIRGPGDYFGTRQSGFPELKVADLIRDYKLLTLAKEEADFYLQPENRHHLKIFNIDTEEENHNGLQ
ncbi:ATP-dependent DNA helicase RecG, partial [bacterium]|nr:ATP-dependent DNA helicase RecG [bacterium]